MSSIEAADTIAPPCSPNTVEQIAFADRVLLNKTDLVSQSERDTIKQRIKVRVSPGQAWHREPACVHSSPPHSLLPLPPPGRP